MPTDNIERNNSTTFWTGGSDGFKTGGIRSNRNCI